MADEKAPETADEAPPGSQTRTGTAALDLAGGILGLGVFVLGVVLVVACYRQATELYASIGPSIEAARTGAAEPANPGSGDTKALGDSAGGPITAMPGGRPLAKVAAELGLKLFGLLVIALLGFLVAAMGAKLAGAHRGKRT